MGEVSVPLIHITDATALAIRTAVLNPVLPSTSDQEATHGIIYDELCKKIVTDDSKLRYHQITIRLSSAEADCLILGCAEVGMLLNS